MSKKKLIELINMSDNDLNCWLEDVNVKDAREIFRMALKEQDRDTRHGCAEAVLSEYDKGVTENMIYNRCMNYRDKDLEGL